MSFTSERLRRGTVTAFLALIVAAPTTSAFEGEYIFLDDEDIYPMLLRLRAEGAPVHDDLALLPITRGRAAAIVRDTRAALDGGELALSKTGRDQLTYLERELAEELGEEPPGPYHEITFEAQDTRVRWDVSGRLGMIAEPDPDFEPSGGAGTRSPATDVSGTIELRPAATFELGPHLLVQERLNLFWLVGDGVTAAVLNVSQGEAQISEGKNDNVLHRRSFDTMGRLVLGDFALEVGRIRTRWGNGRRGTLLISDFTPPMDVVRFIGSAGRFRFANMAAELRTTFGQRFLVAHRLSYTTPALTVAMSESVIFGNRAFDFAYLSPFQFFNAVEDNIGATDNNILGADVRWRPAPGYELWGEAILDDWNLRHGFDTYANKIALQAGAVVAGLPGLPDTDLGVEYTIVDQFTYTHVDSINVATHYNGVVGHRIGTDADLLSATLTHWIGARLQLTGRVEQERQGEGDVSIDHRHRTNDHHHFLTGTLERTRRVEAGLRYRTVRGLEVRAELLHERIHALGNDAAAPLITATTARLRVKTEF